MYIAHITGNNIQTCTEHCKKTAEYTAENLKFVTLEKTGYLCGLLHDVGKYTDKFCEYIKKAAKGEPVVRGSVIHSFAGVRLVLQSFHSEYGGLGNSQWANLTAELIATAIGSHHGLFDLYDGNGIAGLSYRMEKQPEYDKTAIDNFLAECESITEIQRMFDEACEEIKSIAILCHKLSSGSLPNFMFYIGSIQRLITSALIDGDRRDTAEFMSGKNKGDVINVMDEMLLSESIENMNSIIDSFQNVTKIDVARSEMSEYCYKFAEKNGAVYRLNLPTGAGKTLSSLRYALNHAKLYNKQHIVFSVPLLSVLDQNSEVIRAAVGNDRIVLEHHSNVVIEDETTEEYDRRNYLIDTWDSPIIITTLVQLLNTFFEGKTSAIRRFHSLIDSVIIIDEVQSVPTRMISMFNNMINFLSSICGVTVILCSATQPALWENINHPLICSSIEFIPKEKMKEYKNVFKRNIVDYVGVNDIDKICTMAKDYLKKYTSVLVICNTKKEALDLFWELQTANVNCVHLSTSMCLAHRRDVLSNLREALGRGDEIVCVSTQLIEAGVDISFGSVIRYSAGIDNIVQAAGRCNRNAKCNNNAPVSIVSLEGEDLSRLADIRRAQNATQELFAEFKRSPEDYDNDIVSDKAVEYYYKRLFAGLNNNPGFMEYECNGHTLFDLLSINRWGSDERVNVLRQAFKTAGKEFKVFDNNQVSILVPYGKGEDLIAELLSERAQRDIGYVKSLLKEAKDYSVNIFNYQYENLSKERAIYSDSKHTVLILNPEYYSNNLGIISEQRKEESQCNTLIL